ncbi:hypothetical protein BDV29DRAFT_168894 [Aspergillus leporis]|jgi:hypothetical protein|uniref:Uncharacterized protein n=1 Tax=Aspergillus leporis TaxID=41062 RepID=A0A5N5XCT6_9EURO|nr:hypothetical protein BDV29DRAFT_168894 [Aspergillus leporis]
MEILRQSINDNPSVDVRELLERELKGLPDVMQLELLTGILTTGAEVDEKLAELVHTAWTQVCEKSLWSLKYESLEQYRQLITYQDAVRPIIRRFKKSDRAKAASLKIIEQNWKLSVDQVIPRCATPRSWSKHLLFLLATLSRKKGREEAVRLLETSMNQRPHKSRQTRCLMASDVQRVLGDLSDIESGFQIESEVGSYPASDLETFNGRSMKGQTTSCGLHRVHTDQGLSHNDGPCGCSCAPICLPLMLLMSVEMPTMTDQVVVGLLRWAQSVSWASLCLLHLRRLARYKFGDMVDLLSRSETVNKLEKLLLDVLNLEQFINI